MEEQLTFEPSPDIAGKFEIVNTSFPIFRTAWATYDFRTITVAEAAYLESTGAPYIRKIEKPAKKV